MEPGTTVGLAAITAYLAKDGIDKLLGPTVDYLGEGLRDITRRRVESLHKIFSNACKKAGSDLDTPGEVPPRILRMVVNEASYCEDALALEYFGGVLASSRTANGRDDRGARLMRIVDNLSTYQIRTHYLLYSTISHIFLRSSKRLSTDDDRAQLEVFLPSDGYESSMGFSQKEWNNPQIMHHIWHGLSADNLIEGRWIFGDKSSLRTSFSAVPNDEIICRPSSLGVELFLWAFGYRDFPLEHILSGDLATKVNHLPEIVVGAIATKSHH